MLRITTRQRCKERKKLVSLKTSTEQGVGLGYVKMRATEIEKENKKRPTGSSECMFI